MSSGIEPIDIIDPWLYATFSGDLQITAAVGDRIFADGAPGPQRLPAITWNLNSARDITQHQGHTLWVEALYEVKVLGQGSSYEPIREIARRMDALIHAAEVTTADGSLSCRRDRVIRYPELDDNIQYRHLGGIYRILAHSTS